MTQITYQEFDQLIVYFQRKAALLEIAAKFAAVSVSGVPTEFVSALDSTKKSLLDSINQLQHPFNQPNSNKVNYLLVTSSNASSNEKLKTLYNELKESYPIGTDVLFNFIKEGPFIIVSLPSERDDLFSVTQHHDVTVFNITKEEYEQFNKSEVKDEHIFLKVMSLNNKIEDLQLLNNDLDLLCRHQYVGEFKKAGGPFVLLSFAKSNSKRIFDCIETHKASICYAQIPCVLYDYLRKQFHSQPKDVDRVHLQIFSNALLSERVQKLSTFLQQLSNLCNEKKINFQITGRLVDTSSVEPSFVVTTEKKHIPFIENYASVNGFSSCLTFC